eukprot:jgi/Mesvir1/1433/Mv25481-RA.1
MAVQRRERVPAIASPALYFFHPISYTHVLETWARLQDPQTKELLLWFCAHPRVVHWLRGAPPHLVRLAAEGHDERIQAALQVLLPGPSLPAHSMRLATPAPLPHGRVWAHPRRPPRPRAAFLGSDCCSGLGGDPPVGPQRRQRHSRLGHPIPLPLCAGCAGFLPRDPAGLRPRPPRSGRPPSPAGPGARPACPLSSVLVSTLPAFMKNNKRPTRVYYTVPTGWVCMRA